MDWSKRNKITVTTSQSPFTPRLGVLLQMKMKPVPSTEIVDQSAKKTLVPELYYDVFVPLSHSTGPT